MSCILTKKKNLLSSHLRHFTCVELSPKDEKQIPLFCKVIEIDCEYIIPHHFVDFNKMVVDNFIYITHLLIMKSDQAME